LDNNGEAVGYNNGLYLNRSLKDHQSWGVEDIELRTTELVKEVLDNFLFLGESLSQPNDENT